MNKDLHKHYEPLISAEEGWKQMQQLLDENLPLKINLIRRNAFIQYLVACSLLVMLMLPSLQLNETQRSTFSVSITKNTFDKIDTKNINPIDLHNSIKNTASDLGYSNQMSIKKNKANLFLKSEVNHIVNSKLKEVNAITVRATEEKNTNIVDYNPAKGIDSFTTRTIHSENTQTDNKNRKSLQKRSWTLLAGFGTNLPIKSNTINVIPYPVLELRYNFTPRLYFSTGISPYAFVNNSAEGISKSVYVNDTVNNISMDKETTTYDHFHYLDIPIHFGINVTKRIALHSGLQVSFLLDKKEKKSLERYDFLMNRLNVPATSIMSFVPNATAEYEVKVRNIDYRFLAGIRYDLSKVSIGFTHQHGLTSLLTNNNVSSPKNNLASLNLLFKIK